MSAFLANELYKPTTEVVIGTYEKALQHYLGYQTVGADKHVAAYPFMTFDPSLDIDVEDQTGRFPYQYPNIAPTQGAMQWKPLIYEDDNICIAPVLNRYKGVFEIILWCRSVYEYLDLKILTHQFFGGIDRIVYPTNISGYFAIPDSIRYYEHNNPYTQETYKLDWSNNKAKSVIYKTINKEKFVFPFDLKPWIKLTSASDGSEKYGGDSLSEYKLQVTLEWETYLPTHLVLLDSVTPKDKYVLDVSTGAYYVNGNSDLLAPYEITQVIADPDSETVVSRDITVSSRDTYIVTNEDIDNINNDIRIQIPLTSNQDNNSVKIFHETRELKIGYEFTVLDAGNIIELIPIHLKELLSEDDILTIILYSENI
jgi:hypothetical protein